jgi:chemotaxis protein MotA
MKANMLAIPIADKLGLRNDEEQLTQALIIDAIMGIQQGLNPRVIEELLKTYLPGSVRLKGEDAEANAAQPPG